MHLDGQVDAPRVQTGGQKEVAGDRGPAQSVELPGTGVRVPRARTVRTALHVELAVMHVEFAVVHGPRARAKGLIRHDDDAASRH
ncbi:hypothetical protein GCM10023086_53730 [Streptomyces venetus]|uniref:Uncharacterized protein n=1 Tax=Streptomyces venetus TaxID=1701086 RepID=A0ABP8GLL5_9ACTN